MRLFHGTCRIPNKRGLWRITSEAQCKHSEQEDERNMFLFPDWGKNKDAILLPSHNVSFSHLSVFLVALADIERRRQGSAFLYSSTTFSPPLFTVLNILSCVPCQIYIILYDNKPAHHGFAPPARAWR